MTTINKVFQRAIYELKKTNTSLLPHQIDALKWMNKREKKKVVNPKILLGGIIADEMGLGKTLEIISIILGNPLDKTLVIVPANLINQWYTEFQKFAPDLKVSFHNLDNESSVVITSYIKCIRNERIMTTSWDRVILDEGHFIRNPKGKVHRQIMMLKSSIKWILTGTPIQNYMSDLMSLLQFLGFRLVQLEDAEQIEYIIDNYVLRRTKKGLNFNLPDLKQELVYVEHTSIYEKIFYKRLEKNIFKKKSFHFLELLLRLRQASILPQLVYEGYSKKNKTTPIKWKYSNSKLNSLVKNIVNNPEEKPLVFCFFKREIEYLQDKLEENNITYRVINGRVSMDERQIIIKNSNSYQVLILQMMAGSTGLNLQAFNSVHFSGPHWNPTHEQQAIARVYILSKIL